MLDAGCGTGENALHVASLGLPVLGVDVAETALAIARAIASDRGIEVEFAAADAFQLERLGRRFETVLDCGLFHTFDGDEWPGYVASLASVTGHDGTLYVLCLGIARSWTTPEASMKARSCASPGISGSLRPAPAPGRRRGQQRHAGIQRTRLASLFSADCRIPCTALLITDHRAGIQLNLTWLKSIDTISGFRSAR